MLARAIEASSRAFGMLTFIVTWLWSSNRAFPSNWAVLGILFIALVPVAFLYRWLTDSRPKSGTARLLLPVSKLVVIGIGATIAILVYISHDTQIDSMFYSAVRQ